MFPLPKDSAIRVTIELQNGKGDSEELGVIAITHAGENKYYVKMKGGKINYRMSLIENFCACDPTVDFWDLVSKAIEKEQLRTITPAEKKELAMRYDIHFGDHDI